MMKPYQKTVAMESESPKDYQAEALELLYTHSRMMAEQWNSSPERRAYKEKFDKATRDLRK